MLDNKIYKIISRSALCVYSLKSIRRKFMQNIKACFNGNGARGLDFISPNMNCVSTVSDRDHGKTWLLLLIRKFSLKITEVANNQRRLLWIGCQFTIRWRTTNSCGASHINSPSVNFSGSNPHVRLHSSLYRHTRRPFEESGSWVSDISYWICRHCHRRGFKGQRWHAFRWTRVELVRHDQQQSGQSEGSWLYGVPNVQRLLGRQGSVLWLVFVGEQV